MEDPEEVQGQAGSRPRTISNASQQSQQSSKQNFPLMTCDSGLYTFSSNASDCSLQLESDTDSGLPTGKYKMIKDERLQMALKDVNKLRSELERLTKSEQWYKQELKQQKSTRLDDLERIYTQERKFMQENQRLQKECVRLYEKCNELERELEQQTQQTKHKNTKLNLEEDISLDMDLTQFEKEQQMALIKDQQQLISVLRKQKRTLLEDLRCLTEEKDEKVMELQRLLADMEYDNKLITKKCSQFAKERINMENNLKQSNLQLTETLQDKLNLQKSLKDLNGQLQLHQQLLEQKEQELQNIQQHFTQKIQDEQDLDEVHQLSIKYQEEINYKTLEIINLKEQLQQLQIELEEIKQLQQQNDLQQRKIEQLNYTLETYQLELQELKTSEVLKNKQLENLGQAMDVMIKDKEDLFKNSVKQQNDLLKVKQDLKFTQQQYHEVQELYKKTQFQLELLELEQGKLKFQSDKDQQEIFKLREKLKEYLLKTKELSERIQYLELEMQKVLKENQELKQETQEMRKTLEGLEQQHIIQKKQLVKEQVLEQKVNLDVTEIPESFSPTSEVNKETEDPDFLELQEKCAKLQAQLDFMQNPKCYQENQQIPQIIHNFEQQKEIKQHQILQTTEILENDKDFLKLSQEGSKLQENLNKLNQFFQEKQQIFSQFEGIHTTNKGMEKLVIENNILKEKLQATETEASTLLIKQQINEKTQKSTQIQEILESQKATIKELQLKLLENDGQLYKMQRKLEKLNENEQKLEDLLQENTKLKDVLEKELNKKTDLFRRLQKETEKLQELKIMLEEIKLKQKLSRTQSTQCNLLEEQPETQKEVLELKQNVKELQQQQRDFLQQETLKKEERLQLLHKMMDIQNHKMLNLQQHEQDWQEMLISLNKSQELEEKTRKELELKRLELEELNQVFAEQNEELRKLEEFTQLLEIKRQQEKQQMQLTFQQEINVMKQNLLEYQQEIQRHKQEKEQLQIHNDKYQENLTQDFTQEMLEYKKELRELKSKFNKVFEEKEELKEYVKAMEEQSKELKNEKREAVFMPQELSLITMADNSLEDLEVLNYSSITQDHLRILTKVLEAEYQRKMQRYDEHIHSLLTNLKSLKKSLKLNEEKTAVLSEEQLKTKEELKDLQKTKRNLEELRLKYEQSQETIKHLQHSLAAERQKYELSDLGKSTQTSSTTYEVSNLIDDYKKLIQQSASNTKRPSTSAIMDLIQRSNQCVPNLQKLETNMEGLKSEIHNFISSYTHKVTSSNLITAASLSVPPSLMDELRAASEGF